MATSGTNTWKPNIEEITVEAYERCQFNPQNLTQRDAVSARFSMNLMFSEWSVRGVNYWTVDQQIQTLTQGTTEYDLPAGTLDVVSMVLRRSSTDTVMDRISLKDYNELPVKTTQARPTQFWFDRQYTPSVYLWQVPENSTDQIVYWRVVQVEDITAANQDADVPYRWTEALCAGLAYRLSVKKKPERTADLKIMAEEAFSYAASDERERATLRITPASVI
tara:strand:- start:255 stop:917 length:663 start_codon:yes stop_codon:yes gene_type:complete